MVGGDLKELKLLLVGRTGNGKSSTGNSVFGEEVFSKNNINDTVASHVAHVDGRRIHVVDGTSIGDTIEDISGGITALSDAVNSVTGYLQSIFGFHAILFVLKYGVRFTKQEKDAVKCVKSMFGEDVFKKWGVVVMTYGDNFQKDEAHNRTFEDWCKSQSGDFKSLYEECDYRCVLFNNKTNSSEQREKLTSLVDSLKEVYTVNEFNGTYCRLTRELFLLSQEVEEKLSRPQGLNKQEVEVLMKKIKDYKIDVPTDETRNEMMRQIVALERRVDAEYRNKNYGEGMSLINKPITNCSLDWKISAVLILVTIIAISGMIYFSNVNVEGFWVSTTVLFITVSTGLVCFVIIVCENRAWKRLEKG